MQKAGQVRYRNDKNGIIHAVFGKIAFDGGTYSRKPKCVVGSTKNVLKPSSGKR